MFKATGFLLVAVFTVSACGPIDDMKEMKNTTAEMKETTKELAEVSKKMNKSTTRIDDSAGNTYRDMRLDTSISNGFKALNEMEAANSLEQKMTAAAYYMASFEFQVWKNKDLDTPEVRQQMFALSVKRLFADIKEYVSSLNDSQNFPPLITATTSADNKLKNLYAIAAILHEVNPNQEIMHKVNNVAVTNMLELITEGLATAKSSNINQLPEYQKIVAQNEELAVLLLQLRYNILTLKSISFVSNVQEKTTLATMYLKSWTPDLSNLSNASKVEYAIKVTQAALDARNRLTSNGHKIAKLYLPVPLISVEFASIIKNMDVKSVKTETNSLAQDLVGSLNELKKGY